MRFFHLTPDSIVPTFFGWTPGLRALAGGRVLGCGCLAGMYQTWRGGVVVILDACAARCPHPHHRPNLVLWARTAGVEARFDERMTHADPA